MGELVKFLVEKLGDSLLMRLILMLGCWIEKTIEPVDCEGRRVYMGIIPPVSDKHVQYSTKRYRS